MSDLFLTRMGLNVVALIGPNTMRGIAEQVAAKHGMTVKMLRGRTWHREPAMALARAEAVWRMRRVTRAVGVTGFSLPEIGRFMGGRDHTTVLHADQKFQTWLEAQP